MAKKITKKERKFFRHSAMPLDNIERLAKLAYFKNIKPIETVGGDQVLIPEKLFDHLRRELNA